MMTLYQFEISPFCDKIRRVLNVKHVPYVTHEVGLIEGQTSYRKLNPAGKVPALADDTGRIVCDSTDIAYYLEERFPDPPLVPREPRERACVHVLEDWADESLFFLEMRLRLGTAQSRARTFEKLLVREHALVKALAPWVGSLAVKGQMKAQGIGRKSDAQISTELRRHLDALAALLSGREYLVAAGLTLADIAVYAQLFAMRDSTEGAAEITKRPDIVTFMDRVDRATRPVSGSAAA